MSVIRVVHIACDGVLPDGRSCDRMFLNADGNATAMRREARLAGWAVGRPGGSDYCPEHADQALPDHTATEEPQALRHGNVFVCNTDDYWRTTAPPDPTTTDQEAQP